MGVFGIFSNSKPSIDSFEKDLNDLNLSINKNNQQIIKLRNLKKKLIHHLIYYLALLYAVVISISIVKLPINASKMNSIRWFFLNQLRNQLLIVLGIPAGSLVLGLLMKKLFTFLIESKAKHVRTLKKKQKTKIEELKKITNYNTTNELLTKYGNKAASPKSSKSQAEQGKPEQGKSRQPNQHQQKQLNIPSAGPVNQPVPPQAQAQLSPKAPHRKTLQDHLLDLLVGTEDDSIENRYALICKNCFSHCGLAPPGTKDPQTVNYVCPYCKTFNGKEIAKEEGPSRVESVSPVVPEVSGSAGSLVEIHESEASQRVAVDK